MGAAYDWDLPGAGQIDSLSLPDLVQSKKTQRDKDWPMVRRLVEVSYDRGYTAPTDPQVVFWLRELRTPEILVEAASRFPDAAARIGNDRDATATALGGSVDAVREELRREEERERTEDRAYWAPLRAELEAMRHARRRTE